MGRPSKGGAHVVTRTLADGSRREYHYAWAGGPAIQAAPGTPAYKAERDRLQQARASGQPVPEKTSTASGSTLETVVDRYLDSEDFMSCSPRTKYDYRVQAAKIVKKFGRLDVAALVDCPDETRGFFLDYRDQIARGTHHEKASEKARGSRRQADYFMQVLNTILQWGKRRGKIKLNPLTDAGVKKLYNVTRADKIWSDEQIDVFRSRASKEIDLAMMLALWTGQRQGDLLRLTWAAYDGTEFKIATGKTTVPVQIPVGGPLKKVLDATPRTSTRILVNQAGVPWAPDGFRTSWGKATKRAGIVDRTFHDVRGTAVTNLARAGCTPIQIAEFTGHKLSQVKTILEKHYLARDPQIARDAIVKLEAYHARKTQISKRPQAIEIVRAENDSLENISQRKQRFGTDL